MQSDKDIFTAIREQLHSCVIGDVLDTFGLVHQFLPPEIRAVRGGDVLVGRAKPVLEADCATDLRGVDGNMDAFGLMFRALDSLKADEIYICTGSSHRYALWGELMTTRALELGAAGAIVDGFHRDTRGILALPMPVFSRGAYAQDQRVRGRVIDYNCPIEFGNGTRVAPGDVLVGDIDGVVCIPAASLHDVVAAALRKVVGEEEVRTMIMAGQGTQDIFDKTGIM